MNEVDTSQNTVNGTWESMVSKEGFKLSDEWEVVDEEKESTTSTDMTAEPEKNNEEAIAMAAATISGALKFAISGMAKIELLDSDYDSFSRPLAVVICKHYDGGIIEFIEAWKEELALIMATLVFARAVVGGIRLKNAKTIKEDKPETNKEGPKNE